MAHHNLHLESSMVVAAINIDRKKTLNYDLLAEVFSYLPAQNLSRLQLVSKYFHHLFTSDPHFLLMQSYHNSHASAIFVEGYFSQHFFLLDSDAGIPPASLDILFADDAKVLCSAGGLVFYHKRDPIFYGICAYNPAFGKCCLIPIPLYGDDAYALRASLAVEFTNYVALHASLAVEFTNYGDGITRDYKLIYLTPTREWSNFYRCRVYDSATQVWTRDERVGHGIRDLKFHNPVVHRGAVFWASDCSGHVKTDPYVMSYDIATGDIEFLGMPDDGVDVEGNDEISVAIWEESWLCLVHYRRRSGAFMLWRWSEESHSWVMLKEWIYSGNTEAVGSLLVCNGGRAKGMLLVFSVKDEAYVYSFKHKDLAKLGMKTGSYYPNFTAYSNTLRPACRGHQAPDPSD